MARKRPPKKTAEATVVQHSTPAPRFYLTTGLIRLYSGTVVLDQQQAATRALRLYHLGDDCYAIMDPIEFIAGEIIGFLGDPPPPTASLLEPANG